MREANFAEMHEELTQEVSIAIMAYYQWKWFDELLVGNEELLRVLNEAPDFWRYRQTALLDKWLLGLSRLRDHDAKAHSIDKLFGKAIKEISHFSLEALRKRKRSVFGTDEEGLDRYMKGISEPDSAKLKQIAVSARKALKFIENHIHPIRHKILAHREMMLREQRAELFQNVKLEEVEKHILTIKQTLEIYWELENNGRAETSTRLHDNLRDTAKRDIEKVFSRLAKPSTSAGKLN